VSKKRNEQRVKRLKLGRRVMFDAMLTVYLVKPKDGSTVTWAWTREGYITVDVGWRECWAQTFSGCLHEIMEAAFVLRRCHLRPSENLRVEYDAADSYVFHARHYEFTEICAHAGDVLAYLGPDLHRAWMKLGGKE
jgi:hypothetical protein